MFVWLPSISKTLETPSSLFLPPLTFSSHTSFGEGYWGWVLEDQMWRNEWEKKTKNRGRNKYTAQVEYLCEGCNNIPWTMSKTSLWIHKKIESIPSVSFIRVGWGSFTLPYIPSMLIDVYIYSVIKILTPICKTCLDCSMKAPLTRLIFYIPAVCIALRFKCSAPSNAIPITRNMYSVI